MTINREIGFGALVCLIVLTGCQNVTDQSIDSTQTTVAESQPSQRLTNQQSQQLNRESKPVTLFRSYLMTTQALMIAVAPPDRRSAEVILTDLKALPKDQLLGLRKYVISQQNWPRQALDLMGQLMPDGHREFLIEAVDSKGWRISATRSLVELNDPSVVGPILAGTSFSNAASLLPIAQAKNPGFFTEARRHHLSNRTQGTSFLMGCFGYKAEQEIRACMTTDEKYVRRSVLSGLAKSLDEDALQLMLDICDLTKVPDRTYTSHRFVLEGQKHVDKLITWLDESPEKEKVATYALARISSEKGVTAVLTKHQDQPYENVLAGQTAQASPMAARAFVADRVVNGTRQQKLNALLVAHHLTSDDPPQAGKEHPLLERFIIASHDTDAEVRFEATGEIQGYAPNAHYPDGQKALLRLIEMLNDPSPRVRGGAAGKASQYPCAEVVDILKKMAENEDDERTRDHVIRVAKSLEERLRGHVGRSDNLVYLPKRG